MMIQETPLLIQRWGFSFGWISIRYHNTGNRPCIDMIYAIMHNLDNIDFRTKM